MFGERKLETLTALGTEWAEAWVGQETTGECITIQKHVNEVRFQPSFHA